MDAKQVLISVVLSLSVLVSSVNATPIPGFTPGEFSVDASGSANYQIPIAVPPGSGGMAPSLSLSYNSNSGNGLLGQGWTLGGLSVITRCPATKVQDGFIDGVDFDDNDRYCIDGQRLIAVQGNYGANGTEYRTELDGFTKVISYEIDSNRNGPEYFKAWTKSGQILEYGNENTRVEVPNRTDALLWPVNKIEDTVGNYIKVTYDEDNAKGSYRPKRIAYTGNENANLSPYAYVDFDYENRADITTSYLAGSKYKLDRRLEKIRISNGSTLIREYRIAYENKGITNQSFITQIEECNGSGKCFDITDFRSSIKDNNFQILKDEKGEIKVFGGSGSKETKFFFNDYNGDGLTDYIYWNYSASNENFRVYLAKGDGTFSNAWNVRGSSSKETQYFFDDYNGDGLTDYIYWNTNVSGGAFRFYFGKGDGSFRFNNYSGGSTSKETEFFFGDYNADGITDYIYWNTGVSGGALRMFYGNGDGTFVKQVDATGSTSKETSFFFNDYNGDGITDYIYWNTDVRGGKFRVFLGKGEGGFNYVADTGGSGSWETQFFFNDFNGDGLTDYIYWNYSLQNENFKVYLATGNGEFKNVSNIRGSGSKETKYYFDDYNGDGIADYIYWNYSPSGDNFKVYLGRGDGTFENVQSGRGSGSKESKYFFGDFTGDGVTDYLYWNYSVGKGEFREYISNTDHRLKVDEIKTPLTTTSIDYSLLTDPQVYQKDSGANYPDIDLQGPMYVVSKVTVDDGVGGTRDTTYKYEGLKSSYLRGSLGFKSMTATDELTGIVTRTEYNQSYPYVGQVVQSTETYNNQTASAADDVLLSELTNSYQQIQTHTGTETVSGYSGVLFPYANNVVKKNYELNTGALVSTVTTEQFYDSYGNPTQIDVTTMGNNADGVSERFKTKTVNSYSNNTSKWHLGRLLRTDVTNTLPNNTSQTRSSAFEYDTNTGLLTKEIIEPDNAAIRLITEYEYDAFGNKTKATVSGGQ